MDRGLRGFVYRSKGLFVLGGADHPDRRVPSLTIIEIDPFVNCRNTACTTSWGKNGTWLNHTSTAPADRRRRIDVALHAVIMEAYVHGTSTRKGTGR